MGDGLKNAAGTVGQGVGDFLGVGESSAREQNQIDRERADNAIQRQYKDLEKAGINPLLASGMQGSPTGQASAGGQGGGAAASIINSAMNKYKNQEQKKQLKLQTQQSALINKKIALENAAFAKNNKL